MLTGGKDVQFGTQVTLLSLVPCNHGRWLYLVADANAPSDDPEVLAIYVDPQPLELVRKRFELHLQQREWENVSYCCANEECLVMRRKPGCKIEVKEMYLAPNH